MGLESSTPSAAFQSSQVIPDGRGAPVSMFSARFDGGEVEQKMRRVHKLLKEHHFENLMVAADAGDDFGRLTMQFLARIHQEGGVMLAVCTPTYGEITKSKYSSNFELRYAYDNDLRVLPLKVVEMYPPKPPYGKTHPYDQVGEAQTLVKSVLPDSKVFLDCCNASAGEIASMIARKLLGMPSEKPAAQAKAQAKPFASADQSADPKCCCAIM